MLVILCKLTDFKFTEHSKNFDANVNLKMLLDGAV